VCAFVTAQSQTRDLLAKRRQLVFDHVPNHLGQYPEVLMHKHIWLCRDINEVLLDFRFQPAFHRRRSEEIDPSTQNRFEKRFEGDKPAISDLRELDDHIHITLGFSGLAGNRSEEADFLHTELSQLLVMCL
jgi:hypothetical protein